MRKFIGSCKMITELEFLARKYGTDKNSLPGNNGYIPLYLEYFNRLGFDRGNIKKVLEIGTNKGASLRTWAEYFINAEIYGVDVTRQYEIPELLNHDRIHTLIINPNQSILQDINFKNLNLEPLDLIILDTGHDQYEDQRYLVDLFPLLKKNGLFVIEDVITGEPWWCANTYNKNRVKPTRVLLQELENNKICDSEAITKDEANYLIQNILFCEYRESDSIIYERHRPQIGFMGHK